MARARSCLIPETAGRAPRRFTLRAGASRRVVLKVFICNDFLILPDARLRPRGWGVCSSPGVSNGANPAQRAVLSWASRWEARLPLMVRVSNGSRAKSFNLQGDRSERAHDDRLFFDLPGPRFRRWERRSSACGGGLSLTTRAWRGAHLIPPRGHPAASNQITTGSPVGWQA